MILHVEHLTLDYLREPMGIDQVPQFGWKLLSETKNVRQTACRVQIAEDAAFSRMVFDSGEIGRGDSAHYMPDSLPLRSAARYWWRVWVLAEPGAMQAWSEAATFVTALMHPAQWAAKFISAETEADADSSRATCLQKTFAVSGEVESAYAFATALGVYELHLDGKKIGTDELAPGFTSYHKHLRYQTYDITSYLTGGEHTVSGWVGVGWYKGLMGFFHNRNNYGERTALLCQIEITYKDGRKQQIVSDESWAGYDTPILFSDIYGGETYDARVRLHSKRDVAVVSHDFASLRAQPGCRVRIMDALPAKALLHTPKGETVIDFGQNLTGFVRFSARGKPGDTVILKCFEALDRDGNVYTENLRAAKQTITYTLAGHESETYQPHFTFQGFRYAHILSYPGMPRMEDFTACAVHSDMESTGDFSCSNPLLNQLWHNVRWGLKGNFLDVPTDCPQRDERLGWTGDAQIFSATACFLMNAYPFFAKWLVDLAADQTEEGGVPHVVPDIVTGKPGCEEDWLLRQGTHSAAAWADAAVIIPWNLYIAYGGTAILRAQYASMRKWVEFMRSHAEGCVWRYRLQFGDWVALDAAEGSYLGATPNELVCAAYYAHSTHLLAKAARALGLAKDAEAYEALHGSIKRDFAARFFTPEGELSVKTQTAHVLALHFGLTPEAFKQQTVEGLLSLLDRHDGHLVTGFVGTPYIAHALSDSGRVDEAYALVQKEDFPSWLYQVKMGATTIWEHWDGIKPDGSMWSADMNSFNHYAYGAVGEWLFKAIGGISPDEETPGYRHAYLAPRIGGGLTHAEASLETVYGKLTLRWERMGDEVRMDVQIPCNAEATLLLSGSEILSDAEGILAQKGETIEGRAGSGQYHIAYRIGSESK